MSDAIVGGLVGGLFPAAIAFGGFFFGAGRLQGTVTQLNSQVVELGNDIKDLTGSITTLSERVATLEGAAH